MKKKIVFVIVAIIVIIGVLNRPSTKEKYEKFEWSNNELTSLVPEPKSHIGKVHEDSDSKFDITVAKISESDYEKYFDGCKEEFNVGFPSVVNTYCQGYNKDDIKLTLLYDKKEKSMDITIENPQYSNFVFPNNEMASLLPVPKSLFGKVSIDSSGKLLVYVANTSKDDYLGYIEDCKSNGFTEDYDAGDDFYYADNSNGYHLCLNYRATDVMEIEVFPPSEEFTNSDTSEEATSSTSSNETSKSVSEKSGIDPQFKEAMDSYEEFMNEYCEFMKKYSSSNDTASLMNDYANYMKKYADMTDKINSIDEDELNAEELAYYTEVSARVMKKLSGV